MDIRSKLDCESCCNNGHPVKIVARTRFLSEQISIFLEQRTGACCRIYDSLSDLATEPCCDSSSTPLILLEANKEHVQATHKLCDEVIRMTHRHHLLAIFNTPQSTRFEKDALACGIRGIFHEDDHADDLIKGVCSIMQGELWVSRKVMSECFLEQYWQLHNDRQAEHHEIEALTGRQKAILSLIASGASNQSIADTLCISTHTVKTHIYNIFRKIDVPSRTQAALWAAKHLCGSFMLFSYFAEIV